MDQTYTPPSSWRLPLTILVAIVALPLALVAWIALSGSGRADYLSSRWVRAGFVTLVCSVTPLLLVVLAASLGLTSDPNPNPIGLGLLMVAGGFVATILVAVGVVRVARGA